MKTSHSVQLGVQSRKPFNSEIQVHITEQSILHYFGLVKFHRAIWAINVHHARFKNACRNTHISAFRFFSSSVTLVSRAVTLVSRAVALVSRAVALDALKTQPVIWAINVHHARLKNASRNTHISANSFVSSSVALDALKTQPVIWTINVYGGL